jgi:hypothetical protein
VGFSYGGGLIPSGSATTDDEMKKDGEEGEGEIEVVQVVPPDMTEDADDVQVIRIDPMDETDQTG